MTLKQFKKTLEKYNEDLPVCFHDEDGGFYPYAEICEDSTCNEDEMVIRITLADEQPECACADGGTCDQVHEDEPPDRGVK